MDKEKILNEIFENDPLGILEIKQKSSILSSDDRLLNSFDEINDFVEKNKREPSPNTNDVSEYQLYSRLKGIRESKEKIEVLKQEDRYNLLNVLKKEISTLEDILQDDMLNILDDDSNDLFEFRHTPKDYERARADFVARRKPCKDFKKYESMFKDVQTDLAQGKRKIVNFKEDNLYEGNFYIHNGVLMLLEKINITSKEQSFVSGKRTRKDGRTRCIFENGTESDMLYRSLAKILYVNGSVVTENIDKINENFIENFSNISDEDKEVGYIYVLKSKSKDEKIKSIKNLYKVGYSETNVNDRIKNAELEPTYLMASVNIVCEWKCYNMNPQKLELLLHNFFGKSCLEIDIFDRKGRRHTPREWFIVPIEIIEQAIELIISGKIVNYLYDAENEAIIKRY